MLRGLIQQVETGETREQQDSSSQAVNVRNATNSSLPVRNAHWKGNKASTVHHGELSRASVHNSSRTSCNAMNHRHSAKRKRSSRHSDSHMSVVNDRRRKQSYHHDQPPAYRKTSATLDATLPSHRMLSQSGTHLRAHNVTDVQQARPQAAYDSWSDNASSIMPPGTQAYVASNPSILITSGDDDADEYSSTDQRGSFDPRLTVSRQHSSSCNTIRPTNISIHSEIDRLPAAGAVDPRRREQKRGPTWHRVPHNHPRTTASDRQQVVSQWPSIEPKSFSISISNDELATSVQPTRAKTLARLSEKLKRTMELREYRRHLDEGRIEYDPAAPAYEHNIYASRVEYDPAYPEYS